VQLYRARFYPFRLYLPALRVHTMLHSASNVANLTLLGRRTQPAESARGSAEHLADAAAAGAAGGSDVDASRVSRVQDTVPGPCRDRHIIGQEVQADLRRCRSWLRTFRSHTVLSKARELPALAADRSSASVVAAAGPYMCCCARAYQRTPAAEHHTGIVPEAHSVWRGSCRLRAMNVARAHKLCLNPCRV